MTTHVSTQPDPTTVATDSSVGTRRLLIAGVVSGPIFMVVAVLQMLTRDGFDLRRHPVSLLSVGEHGWVQIANFTITGLLVVGFSVGFKRMVRQGRGSRWVPRFLGGFGLGLIAGGAFVADPAFGFPSGTPDSLPAEHSWHGLIHAVAPPLAFVSLICATILLSRRVHREGHRALARYSMATGILGIALTAWPGTEGVGVQLFALAVSGFAWTSVLALWLLRSLPRTHQVEESTR